MTAPLWQHDEVERATNGRSTRPWQATGVSIDTRSLKKGDLFVAITGDRHDGHSFVREAFAAGAAGAMVSRLPDGFSEEDAAKTPLLVVRDAGMGLNNLARAARRRSAATVIGVTGSVGKTGTKEALRTALAGQGKTTASEGNLNNHWGVPLSLARMPADADYGVFEMGMNRKGEIAFLSDLAQPDIAIITTIEPVHMAYFNSVHEIAEAKAEIFDGMDGGIAILNRDNPFFLQLESAARQSRVMNLISFGTHPEAQARLLSFKPFNDHSQVSANIEGHVVRYRLALLGRHWALNTLAALAAAAAAGADLDRAAQALATMLPLEGRGRRHRVPIAQGVFTLIDESYNASPPAVRAAIDILGHMEPGAGGRRIAVLGDMLELGDTAPQLHASLATAIAAAEIDLVFTTGENMRHLHDALPRCVRGGHGDTAEDSAAMITDEIHDGDIVTVKGSHGIHMEKIVQSLLDLRAQPRIVANQGH